MFGRKTGPVWIGVVLAFVLCSVGTAAEFTVMQLRNVWVLPPRMSDNGYVVWLGCDGTVDDWEFCRGDTEIFLNDGRSTKQITNDDYVDIEPETNDNGYVVWMQCDGEGMYPFFCDDGDYEIFLYDGANTTQLTNNDYDDEFPQINNNGYVVWAGDHEIFLYDGISTTQLTNNGYNRSPRLNGNGHVVWSRWDGFDDEVFLYDGTGTTQLTNNDYDDEFPQINDSGYVVWSGSDGSDYEIFLYDGTSTIRITDNDGGDWGPLINNQGRVVWYACDTSNCGKGGDGDYEIFLYDGIRVTRLTDNTSGETDPAINNSGHVVWSESTGLANEIFLYDGTSTTQITHGNFSCRRPQINDQGWVSWQHWFRTYAGYLALPCSFDDDNDDDGYISSSCGGDDCRDFSPNVNPGMTEIPWNKQDDDCDASTPAYPQTANTIAASYGRCCLMGSGAFNSLALLLIPASWVALLKLRRNRTRRYDL